MKRRSIFLTALVAVGLGAGSSALADPSIEYPVKAAFLGKFLGFIEWPDEALEGAGGELHICVLGRDPFGESLRSLAGAMAGERRVVVSTVRSALEVGPASIVFVSEDSRWRWEALRPELDGRGVVSVGEWPGFLEEGGTINFLIVDNNVRFEVSERAANDAGVEISSRLLNVAQRVLRQEPPDDSS